MFPVGVCSSLAPFSAILTDWAKLTAFANVRSLSANKCFCTVVSEIPHTNQSCNISLNESPKSQCSATLRKTVTYSAIDLPTSCLQVLK